jgi:hypothetical protein
MSAVSWENSRLKSTFLCRTKIRPCVSFVRTVYQFSKSVTLSGTRMRVIKKNMMYSKVRSEPINLKSLQRALWDQQNVFMSRVNENLAAVRASFHVAKLIACRSQWPCGLSRGSWPVGLLGSWVRVPLKACMFFRVFLCCVVLCK